MLRCSDGRLYVGQTSNLDARVARHNAGMGAAFTASRRPVELVYFESHHNRGSALARERQLKNWSLSKKLALIRGDLTEIHRLSRRRRWRP